MKKKAEVQEKKATEKVKKAEELTKKRDRRRGWLQLQLLDMYQRRRQKQQKLLRINLQHQELLPPVV